MQNKVTNGEVELSKISTHDNVPDALTKHVEWNAIMKHMRAVNAKYESGRHPEMPQVVEEEREWNEGPGEVNAIETSENGNERNRQPKVRMPGGGSMRVEGEILSQTV